MIKLVQGKEILTYLGVLSLTKFIEEEIRIWDLSLNNGTNIPDSKFILNIFITNDLNLRVINFIGDSLYCITNNVHKLSSYFYKAQLDLQLAQYLKLQGYES